MSCEFPLLVNHKAVIFLRWPMTHLRFAYEILIGLETPEEARRCLEAYRGAPVFWPEPFRVATAENLGPLRSTFADKTTDGPRFENVPSD